MNARSIIGLVLLGMALAISSIFWGLDLWITLGTALCYTAGLMRFNSISGLAAGLLYLGYSFTVPLFGSEQWISTLIGSIAIALIIFTATASSPSESVSSTEGET